MFQDANGSADTGSQPTSGEQQSTPNSPQGESKFEKAMETMREGMENSKGTTTNEELPDKKGDTPNWEERYKELHSYKDREVTQAYQRAEKIAIDRIKAEPAYIHTLAQEDRDFCDRIIKNDSECQQLGLKNYDDLIAYFQKQQMPDETRAIIEKVEKLESKLSEKEAKELEEAKKSAELFLTQFKEQHPDFKGEMEKEVFTLFDNSKLSLQECYDYIKYRKDQAEDINQREEKAWQSLKQKEIAGVIPASGARSGKSSTKNLSKIDLEFLEGIGAKKSLAKHGY